MSHLSTIKVRGFHLDLYGHVNNARYLEFLEEARWNFLEDAGSLAWFMEHGYSLVISRIAIDYLRPATMGDELLIETTLAGLAARSGHIHQTIRRKDNRKVVVEADITFAVLHADQRGALNIDGEIACRLQSCQPEGGSR
ncbi:acyl-CoA thioesterase [Chitinilyticum piscinae]|uniref:Acyl-CoA thioesterase n=1 Tax=Chitinilyticum piscinae TaxID=2866724 RepID=A0A8J7G1U6_9NEIS|nr:acyl-CoA thioesterase [Chitinilyticum piscinae]MBE9610430.1 acyl-CoA thioesterase [Chitinilyticum piscinae]